MNETDKACTAIAVGLSMLGIFSAALLLGGPPSPAVSAPIQTSPVNTFGKPKPTDTPEPWLYHVVGLNGFVSTYTPDHTYYEECTYAGYRDKERFDMLIVARFNGGISTEIRCLHIPAKKDAWFDFRGIRFWIEALDEQSLTVRYKRGKSQ